MRVLNAMPISLDEVQRLIAAAHDKARQEGIRVTVAVVDEGGLLLGLARMDGAAPLSSQIAEAKAVGAALWHRDGDSLAEVLQSRPAFFSQIDKLVRLPLIGGLGSLLIRREGGVLGAVGVSGAQPEQDKACAQAGLDALQLRSG
jgi:glc operon protein GlcG